MRRALSATGKGWSLAIFVLLGISLAACGGGGDGGGGGGGNPTVPAAPASLKATAVSNSAIDLVWVDASGNEDGFRVYRGSDIAAVTDNIATLGPGVQSYSDIGLAASTNYYYKVTAFNILGESAASNIDNATTGPVTIPAAPTNLVAALATGSDVGLTWNDNSNNEDGFRVYRGSATTPFALIVPPLAADSASYTDVSSSGDTTYIYRVTAFNAGGESPPAQSNPVGTPTVVASVEGGNRHSLAVKSSGTVWAWGSNDNGALGIGSGVISRLAPVVVPGVAGATAVSAGDGHSLVLMSDGTIMAWGQNFFGAVGSGDNVTPQYLPVRVKGFGGVGVFDNVAAVSAGGFFSVALRNDGTVWTWGSDFYGQLGHGTVQSHSFAPVHVTALTGIIAISAGQNHTLALKSDGTVWAWGRNQSGQIGNGTSGDNVIFPVQVGGLDNVVAVAAGEGHSLALRNDGTVWAWGGNSLGELGDGTTDLQTTPVQVTGPLGAGFLDNVSAISAGGFFSVALRNDGTAWAWGSSASGQLGNGENPPPPFPPRPNPIQVLGKDGIGVLESGRQISAAKDHSLVLRGDKKVWAWGGNDFGQIGDNSTADRPTPVQVSGF